jgi:hypothetical protein
MQINSIYNKIRDILYASSKNDNDIKELSESIQGKYNSFVYFRKNENGVVIKKACSTASIRKKIRFCIELDLLKSEDNCLLTDLGKNALEKESFDLVLQQAVLRYLEKKGVSLEEIESAINKLIIPDAFSLYKLIDPSYLTEDIFRTCLFLLSQCGASRELNPLKIFSKKLYITKDRETKNTEIIRLKRP